MTAKGWRTEDWVAVYLGFFVIAVVLAAFSWKWFDLGVTRSTFRFALEAVPLERFARFLEREDWTAYCAAYQRHYLAGELDALVAAAEAFPAYCEPIIGVAHCPGVLAALREREFSVYA